MSDFLIKQIEATENTIKTLQEHAEWLRSMVEKEAPKKWSPVCGTWHIDANGIFRNSISTKNRREFGTERSTEAQVERASVEMRRFNRLLALRDELCGDDVVDWKSSNTPKYFLVYNAFENVWDLSATHKSFVTPCFKTEEQARLACNMLNMGEVEL